MEECLMKYKNAKNIFPDDILEELQKYVQGEYVYIPIKDKAVNANITEYGMEVQKRDDHIYTKFLEGLSNRKLSQIYCLSESSIRRIIINQRKKYNRMKEMIEDILANWNLVEETVKQVYDSAWQVGEEFVLKVYDNVEALNRNTKMLSILDDRGIPVSKLVRTKTDAMYVNEGDFYYILTEKLRGNNIIQLCDVPDIGSKMGTVIARLHLAFNECESQDEFWNNSLLAEMEGWISDSLGKDDWQLISKDKYESTLRGLKEREMEYGLFRVPIPEFSEAAYREGLVNAFCHRDYTVIQAVRVAIEDEGLTISSPGGFIEGVNLKNLLTVEPHGRNPILADALKRIGLAEKTGRGIDRIFEGSIVFGRPLPDYSETTSTYVKLFIQRAEPDLAFTKMISSEENRLGRSLPINSLLILSALQSQRRLTIAEIAEVTNIGEIRAKAVVEKLVEAGLVDASGNNKARFYILSSKVYKEQDNIVGYVRQTGIDAVKYEAWIMELIQKQGGRITRDNVVELLNVTPSQAYRLLKKMSDKGKIKLVGSGRSAYYELI